MTAREQQLAAAKVLVTLLTEDLPPVRSWYFYGGEELNGQFDLTRTATQRLANLQTWADFLGVEIHPYYYDEAPGGAAEAVGEIEGIRVKVWSAFTTDELAKFGESRD
jgi:hypothetical protein